VFTTTADSNLANNIESESVLVETGGQNTISGKVFNDLNDSGPATIDAGETGTANVTVNLYRDDGDISGAFDPNDSLIATTVTDNNGDYSFGTSLTGNFILTVDTNTLPSGHVLTQTTSPTTYQPALLPNTPSSDINNNFGHKSTGPVTPTLDFGDAPDSYKTTLSNDGPRHTISTNLFMGINATDAEADAATPLDGTGDDVTGVDDEDGVILPEITTVGGVTYSIPVTVTNSTGSNAYLVGYLDFNKDGDFDDPNEKSATVTIPSSGSNPRTFRVLLRTPSGMSAGNTYARFRLSNTQSEVESSFGLASSGEVEDHQVTLFTPSSPTVCPANTNKSLTWDAVDGPNNNFYSFNTSGVPPAKTFTNVDTSGVDVKLSFEGNTSLLTNRDFGSPSVFNGSIKTGSELFDGGFSPPQNNLQINISGARNEFMATVVEFLEGTTPKAIDGVQFDIFDVDKRGPTNDSWQDRIVVEGYNNGTLVLPNLTINSLTTGTNPGHVFYGVNNDVVATANDAPASGSGASVGTVGVSFSEPITSFKLKYYNGPDAKAVSDPHAIGLIGKVDFCSPSPTVTNPNVLLVKRITAINGPTGTTTATNGDPIDGYTDDPDYPYDDNNNNVTAPFTQPGTTFWPDPNTFLIGAIDGGEIEPNDIIEYTIYFLSAGTADAKDVLLCDRLPVNTEFEPDTFTAGKGIRLEYNGSTIDISNDGSDPPSKGQYIAPGIDPATIYPGIKCGGTDPNGAVNNTNGAIVVNLGDLPRATAQVVPPSPSYGYVRFRAKFTE
jgi:uncharacterized repeat protein (TIGR01451 family)